MKVSDIIDLLQATLVSGSADAVITGCASLSEAQPGDASYFGDPRYKDALLTTKATVILVSPSWTEYPTAATYLAVANPSEAFSTLMQKRATTSTFKPGIHPTAVIGDRVTLDPQKVSIGPHTVIGDDATIGDGTSIGASCTIGASVRIGENCKLHSNVSVYAESLLGHRVSLHSGVVIGADGFGYRFDQGAHQKIPQLGIVQLDDDVEIGANTTIDRARIGRTWIGAGTKIDNLVQIGHNVIVGKHCIIVSQSGIAGSTTLGDYVVIAAQVGIAGHVTVGSQCTIGARSVVTKNLPSGRVTYFGFPAIPVMQERRRMVAARQLPQLFERVSALEENAAVAV